MMQDSAEPRREETPREEAATENGGGPEQALDKERKKAEEYLANWQRAQADFINYKRRTEQERQELARSANAGLILSLLPVLDDLERALGAVPPARGAKQGWLEGIELVARKFRAVMEAQGLQPIKTVGEPFDPNFHEAVRQIKGKEGIVVEEYQKGYTLGDRVLRPAQVVVGNGEEDQKEEE